MSRALDWATCACCARSGYGPHFIVTAPATGETVRICLECAPACVILTGHGRTVTDPDCPHKREKAGHLRLLGKEGD